MLQGPPEPVHHNKRVYREQLRREKESAVGSSLPNSIETDPGEQHY